MTDLDLNEPYICPLELFDGIRVIQPAGSVSLFAVSILHEHEGEDVFHIRIHGILEGIETENDVFAVRVATKLYNSQGKMVPI